MRSVPVSDDLQAYFTNPCPVLSDNTSAYIAARLCETFDAIIEYGMGASTLYFLEAILTRGPARHITFVSVENNAAWFDICIRNISARWAFTGTALTQAPWSMAKINAFLNAPSSAKNARDENRLPLWQESLALGPFFRFSPLSGHRFARLLPRPAWQILRPVMRALNQIRLWARPADRPLQGEWQGRHGQLDLRLRNAGPNIKDQFGQSPAIDDYIEAGLQDIRTRLQTGQSVRAAFIIDGGPRHIIVQRIFELETANAGLFKPTIFLCDACRAFYEPTLAQRPQGRFMPGTNHTLKGAPVATVLPETGAGLWYKPGENTPEAMAAKEVWIYEAA